VVGGNRPLNALNIIGNGNTHIAANINTQGNQTFGGNVILTSPSVNLDLTQEGGSGSINIVGGVTSTATGVTNFGINSIGGVNAINGNISGNINFTYTSISDGVPIYTGVLTLNTANNYVGFTNVGQGATLALSSSGSILNTASVNVDGTFDISQVGNGGTSINALNDLSTGQGYGTVYLGGNTLTIGSSISPVSSGSFSGQINDQGGMNNVAGGGIVIVGLGYIQTLSGANGYTGSTNINQGATLVLSGAGSIASSSSVNVDGTLDISATGASANLVINGGFEIDGSGAIIPSGWTTSGNFTDTFVSSYTTNAFNEITSARSKAVYVKGNYSATRRVKRNVVA